MNDIRPRYRRRSLFGPLLVAATGVVILLCNLRVIKYYDAGAWFSRYWPILLIVWGIFKLGEYLWARRHNEPYPGIGGGGVVFLVFLILSGLGASGISRVHWNIDCTDDWNDPLGFLGTRYEFNESFVQPMPVGAQVRVMSVRGDVSISASPDDQVHVVAHKCTLNHSQEEASQFNNSTHLKFEQQGAVWILDMTGGSFSQGRVDLALQVPPKYAVSVTDSRGNVHIKQIHADVELETMRGDLDAEQINGNVSLHEHRGDVTAKNISGNVSVDGYVDDSTFADIDGTLTLTGSYSGDVALSHVASQVKFNSSRTDLQMAKLDGDLTMDGSDLRVDAVAGPFILRTDSKNVRLDHVTGDVRIDDPRGDIEMQAAAPLGNVDISTTGSQISIELPENPGFQMDAQSDGGEIQSDYSLNINNDRHNATGTVGKGGPQVKLRTNRGTIQIRKD
ncbi:MAG TPA: DUF4097 family beta strand repeat-containing protein [Candidatus Angelobacter sp.]